MLLFIKGDRRSENKGYLPICPRFFCQYQAYINELITTCILLDYFSIKDTPKEIYYVLYFTNLQKCKEPENIISTFRTPSIKLLDLY